MLFQNSTGHDTAMLIPVLNNFYVFSNYSLTFERRFCVRFENRDSTDSLERFDSVNESFASLTANEHSTR